jgi:dTDP-4-dehydrorhamnose reductase
MKVLVTGSEGMLGFALRNSCPAGVEMVGTTIDDLDITNAADVGAVWGRVRPRAVISAAAYTDVDGCESHEDDALAVNGTGAGIVAQACADLDIPVLQVSTDYVFDGRIPAPGEYVETDPVNPLSAYGRTKLAGERAVATATPDHWIVRTQWLYGVGGKNFVETMLRLAAERDRLTVVNDQVGSPTSTHALAPFLWRIVTERPAHGVYHCTNAGACSWYDFAAEIFRQQALDVNLAPMGSDQLDRPAPRPARSILNNGRLRDALGDVPCSWEDALEQYLALRSSVETHP